MSVIIDNTQDAFKDCPPTLNGEVLLERTRDDQGNHSGFLTVSREQALKMKAMTDEELQAKGLLKHKVVLQQVS